MIHQSFTKARLRQVRPEGPLPGDILLFSQALGLTRLVPWFTGSRYYHIGIYEGGPHVLEARPNGVVRRDIAAEEHNVFRIIPMPTEKARIALEFARGCLGSRYGMLTVAALVIWEMMPHLPVFYRDPCRYTCPEFVAVAWREAGVDLFPGRPAQSLVPSDFARFLPVDASDRVLHPPFAAPPFDPDDRPSQPAIITK